MAELLSRYFPDDIQMHSFENVTSIQRKQSNWHLLKKFFKVFLVCWVAVISIKPAVITQHLTALFKSALLPQQVSSCNMQRYDVPVSKDDVERVMAAADGAVLKLLQAIYDYVHEDPSAQAATQEDSQYSQYYDPNAAPSASSPEAFQEAQCSPSDAHAFLQPGMLPYMQQPYASPPGAAYHEQQPTNTFYPHTGANQQDGVVCWPPQYPTASMQYPTAAQQPAYSQQAYEQVPAQYAQQSSFAQQSMSQYSSGMMQHMQPASSSMPPHHMAAPTLQFAAQQQTYELGHSPETSMPSIEYDKRPRAVEYKPYTLQDYSSRNFDAKRQDYWKLGTLGPQIEDEDLQVLHHALTLCSVVIFIRHMHWVCVSVFTACDPVQLSVSSIQMVCWSM